MVPFLFEQLVLSRNNQEQSTLGARLMVALDGNGCRPRAVEVHKTTLGRSCPGVVMIRESPGCHLPADVADLQCIFLVL